MDNQTYDNMAILIYNDCVESMYSALFIENTWGEREE